MIELGIIDLSAEGRRRLAFLIEKWTWVSPDSRVTVPRVSVNLLAPEEIRFHGSLDVCVIGPELIGCDAAFIHTIRQQLPGKLILCILDTSVYSFGLIEQLGRLGVDDVLMDSATSDEFFRRLVLLQRRLQQKKKGRLTVVGSARGGVGATFIAASLAEGWLSKGKRVCLVDCDVISQDLSRFLQVRPHISESLRLLIDQQRVVTSETVAECTIPVWSDEPNIALVPPAAGGDESIFASPRASRAFVAVLEALQMHYDIVVVDTASLPALAINALYQFCDEAVFVANRDPAGAFAYRQALMVIAGCVRPEARVTVVVNDNSVVSASLALIKNEALGVPGREIRHVVIPRSVKAGRWPCSGCTPYQFLNRQLDNLLVADDGDAESVSSEVESTLASLVTVVTAAVRGFTSRGRSGGKGSAAETGGPLMLDHKRFPQLGYDAGGVGDGELVSKPVLMS